LELRKPSITLCILLLRMPCQNLNPDAMAIVNETEDFYETM
jgi:hypothetical protein